MPKLLRYLFILDIVALMGMPVVLDILHADPWVWYFTAILLMLVIIGILDAAVAYSRESQAHEEWLQRNGLDSRRNRRMPP